MAPHGLTCDAPGFLPYIRGCNRPGCTGSCPLGVIVHYMSINKKCECSVCPKPRPFTLPAGCSRDPRDFPRKAKAVVQQRERSARPRGAGDTPDPARSAAEERVKVLEAFCAAQHLTAPAPVVEPTTPDDDPKALKELLATLKKMGFPSTDCEARLQAAEERARLQANPDANSLRATLGHLQNAEAHSTKCINLCLKLEQEQTAARGKALDAVAQVEKLTARRDKLMAELKAAPPAPLPTLVLPAGAPDTHKERFQTLVENQRLRLLEAQAATHAAFQQEQQLLLDLANADMYPARPTTVLPANPAAPAQAQAANTPPQPGVPTPSTAAVPPSPTHTALTATALQEAATSAAIIGSVQYTPNRRSAASSQVSAEPPHQRRRTRSRSSGSPGVPYSAPSSPTAASEEDAPAMETDSPGRVAKTRAAFEAQLESGRLANQAANREV